MAKAEFEETPEVTETESVVEVPAEEEEVDLPDSKPCRDENEHTEHLWVDSKHAYLCEGRRRG
jgi:hypothetical protein